MSHRSRSRSPRRRSRSRSSERHRRRSRSRSRSRSRDRSDRYRSRRSRSRSRDRGRGRDGPRRAPRGRPQMDPELMRTTTNIYVGNLPFATGDNELRDLFSEFGVLTRSVVGTDKHSGRSLGFGFIAFETRAAAEAAMSAMSGKQIGGRELRLDWDPGLDRKPGAKPMARDEPYARASSREGSPRN